MTNTVDAVPLAGPDAIGRQILADARASGLQVGARLPTERQLAERLRISRTSVRQALARLEAAGLLSRHVGRGTFLRSVDGAGAGAQQAAGSSPIDVSPADVMAVRALLEPQAMTLVVARASARDFSEMDRCLSGGDSCRSYDEFEHWDLALHRALIVASHNPLLIQLYASVETSRHGQMWGQLKRRNDSYERRRRYGCQHRAVVDAARSRDGDAAVAAMREHLASVSANIFGHVL